MKRFDMFAEHVPTFTLRGKETIRTGTGSFCSIIIIVLTFMFGLVKLEHLIEKKNPMITANEENLEPD